MTEEEKKLYGVVDKNKPLGQQMADAHNQAVQNILDSTENAIAGYNAATDQYINDLDAAKTASDQQYDAIRTGMVDAQNRYDQGVQSIINEGEARLQREREIAQAEYLASQQAAQGTGLTHLAASIANLIGVGGFNASNQTYQNPSIDWMRKADQDRLYNKQRMDNLRERQRQVQMHQLELQMNNADRLANFDTGRAQQDFQYATNKADTRRQGAIATAEMRSKAEQSAAELRLEGERTRGNIELQERKMAQDAQQHRDSVNMTAARYGLKRNSDGTFSLDPDAEINQLNSAARRSSSGGSKNTYYYTDPDGNLIPVYMTASEYDKFVEQSYAALKDDPDFKKAYDATKFSSGSDLDRKSLIFNYATMDDDRRRVLSQYGPAPEGAQRKTPRATGYGVLKQPTEVRLVDGKYVTVDNTDITGGGVSAGGYYDSDTFMKNLRERK